MDEMVGNGGLVSRGRVIVGPIYLWGVERIVPELLREERTVLVL